MVKPQVAIHYCPGCRWLARSAWLAQELLETFGTDLAGVTLVPSEQTGTFRIELDGDLVWERKRDGGFPQAAELKQRLRDRIAPDRSLGHIDKA